MGLHQIWAMIVSFIRTVSAPVTPMSSAGNRFAGLIAPNHHAAQPLPHVPRSVASARIAINLAAHRDVETRAAREAFFLGTLANL